MKLLLLRHGQSEADILKVMEGRADFSLTNKGKVQAKKVGQWLQNNEEIDMILASPLKRAKETAEIVGNLLGINVQYDPRLMEWDNGLLAGKTRQEADRLYPIPVGGKKPHHEIAQAESEINFRARAEMFLSKLQEEVSKDANILIVSHGGMINMLFQAIMKMPLNVKNFVSCGDTSLHKIIIEDSETLIIYMNKMEHLLGDNN